MAKHSVYMKWFDKLNFKKLSFLTKIVLVDTT